MSEQNGRSSGGEAILALILGGIIGGALGVLLAPTSGKKTRQELAKLTRKWLEEGEDMLDEASEKISKRFHPGS